MASVQLLGEPLTWWTTYYGWHCTNQDREGMVVIVSVDFF